VKILPKTLKFKDGTFKILHMTDFHMRDGDEKDRRTCAFIRKLIESEIPELIVIGGDLIHKDETSYPLAAFEEALNPIAESGIPWAYIFGNHELQSGVEAAKFVEILERMPHSLFKTGPSHIQGHSNYIIRIMASAKVQPAALLYMFDDSMKMTYPLKGKNWIHRNQVSWYANNSMQFTRRNNGEPIPALAFLHVPLPEYKEIWDY
jgi:predicted MPP superfamily phosphohydrolase